MIANNRPIAYILASTDHGTMIVNRYDYYGDEARGYFGVGFELLSLSSFQGKEIEFALWILDKRRERFGDGVFALDCGANIGVHSIEWGKHTNGWGELLAIEAQERVFYALAGNIAINNCFNVRAIWGALGENSGLIDIPAIDYCKPSSFGSFEIKNAQNNEFIGQKIDWSAENCIETTLFTIDQLNLDRLDFIKMDIEGMENEALRGGFETIKKHRPYLFIEKIKADQDQMRSIFDQLDYVHVDLGLSFFSIPKEEMEIIDSLNLFFNSTSKSS